MSIHDRGKYVYQYGLDGGKGCKWLVNFVLVLCEISPRGEISPSKCHFSNVLSFARTVPSTHTSNMYVIIYAYIQYVCACCAAVMYVMCGCDVCDVWL